jgi:3-dehydroquinate dehydratase/shikimate dehydrogenase
MKMLSLPFGTQNEIISAIKESKGFAGYELRSDFFTEKIPFRKIRKICSKKLILALRPDKDDFSTEKQLCTEALTAGFDFIDVDCQHTIHLSELITNQPKRFIISLHTDADKLITTGLENLKNVEGILKKIALSNCSCPESFLFISRCRNLFPRFVLTVMGEEGQWTRSSYGTFGGEWGYFCLPDNPTAPGQLSITQWQQEFGFDTNRHTAMFGIIGHPVSASLSPALHNYCFRQMGLNAIYNRFPTKKPEDFFRHCPPEVIGLSVTSPLKDRVLPWITRTEGIADISGSINTLKRNEQGNWIGFNTDGPAIRALIETRFPDWKELKNIIIIGNGGVAKACLATFGDQGEKIILSGRNPEKVQALAGRFKVDWRKIDQLPPLNNCLLLQTSSGTPDLHPEPDTIVVEIIYQSRTPLIINAESEKCRIIYGQEIFLEQALMQQQIWLGQSLEHEKARRKIQSITDQ